MRGEYPSLFAHKAKPRRMARTRAHAYGHGGQRRIIYRGNRKHSRTAHGRRRHDMHRAKEWVMNARRRRFFVTVWRTLTMGDDARRRCRLCAQARGFGSRANRDADGSSVEHVCASALIWRMLVCVCGKIGQTSGYRWKTVFVVKCELYIQRLRTAHVH